VHQWQHLKKWTQTYIQHSFLFFSSLHSLFSVATNWKKKSQNWLSRCMLSCTIKKTYSSLGFFSTRQGEIMSLLKKSNKRNTWTILRLLNFLFFFIPSSLSLACTVQNQRSFFESHANYMIQSLHVTQHTFSFTDLYIMTYL
jgi:hypothetical protein